MSYFFQRRCVNCDHIFESSEPISVCRECGNVLLMEYDLYKARQEGYSIRDVPFGSLWEFRDILPLLPGNQPISLGEGGTPVIALPGIARRLQVKQLLVKQEGLNPAGSLYDREMSVTLSAIQDEDIETLFVEAAGNLGIAGSAYARLADCACTVILPRGCPAQFLGECQVYGGQAKAIVWNKSSRGKVKQSIQSHTKIFDVSTEGFSYRIEGAKTLFLEIFKQLGNRFPDVILFPVAEGVLPFALWKVLWEGRQLGWFPRDKKLSVWGVQSANCPSFLSSGGEAVPEAVSRKETIAFDLFVPEPVQYGLVAGVLNEEQWPIVTVQENNILTFWRRIAKSDGILLSPEGSAVLAAVEHLILSGKEEPDQTFLIINPSNGSRYVNAIGFIDEIHGTGE